MADYKVTDQELINVANAIKTLFTTNINSEPGYKWTTDYIVKLRNVKESLDTCINKIKELNSESKTYIGNQDGYTLDTLLAKVRIIVEELKNFPLDELENSVDSINIVLLDVLKIENDFTQEEIDSAYGLIEQLVEFGLEKENEEELTKSEILASLIFDLLDLKEQLEDTVAEYESGDYSIVEITSEVSGAGIAAAITDLENARRIKTTTVLPQGAEVVLVFEEEDLPTPLPRNIYYKVLNNNEDVWYYTEDKFVIYATKILYNMNQSFVCMAFKDGGLQQGAYFYKQTATAGGINFYIATAPTDAAKLKAGAKLIRIVLDEYEEES